MPGMETEEAARRQDLVLGQPMRIAPLAQEELGEEVRSLVHRIGATLDYKPAEVLTTYFALLARHPHLFKSQLEMGIFLFSGSAIPPRERELAVLRTAWLAGAPYEWGEHVDIARKLGMTPEETDAIRRGPQAPGWSGHERAILSAVDELVDNKMISDATWSVLAQTWNEAQLIELPCIVGQYLSVAMLQNSLRLPLGERKGFAER